MAINILLLAAGKGLRFQSSLLNSQRETSHKPVKQLASFHGNSLVNHCLKQLKPLPSISANVADIYLCLGANKLLIEAEIPREITRIYPKNWALGLGHSIAESVEVLASKSSHILIALADQVLVNTEHFQQLLCASSRAPEKIIASEVDNKLMVPVIFPKHYFQALSMLQGDKGAAKLLYKYQANVQSVPCQAAKYDIDTNKDLQQAEQLYAQQQQKQKPFTTNMNSHCDNLEPV